MKDGEGFSQRTCMDNPWTQTSVWGRPGEWGQELGGSGQRGGVKGNTCNSVNNNNKKEQIKSLFICRKVEERLPALSEHRVIGQQPLPCRY